MLSEIELFDQVVECICGNFHLKVTNDELQVESYYHDKLQQTRSVRIKKHTRIFTDGKETLYIAGRRSMSIVFIDSCEGAFSKYTFSKYSKINTDPNSIDRYSTRFYKNSRIYMSSKYMVDIGKYNRLYLLQPNDMILVKQEVSENIDVDIDFDASITRDGNNFIITYSDEQEEIIQGIDEDDEDQLIYEHHEREHRMRNRIYVDHEDIIPIGPDDS